MSGKIPEFGKLAGRTILPLPKAGMTSRAGSYSSV